MLLSGCPHVLGQPFQGPSSHKQPLGELRQYIKAPSEFCFFYAWKTSFTQGAEFDPEEDEPTLEAAWPHLQLVYEFFLRCCCYKCMALLPKCCHCHCPAGVLSPQISSPILPKNTSTRDLSWRYGNCYFSSCWFLRLVITAGSNWFFWTKLK